MSRRETLAHRARRRCRAATLVLAAASWVLGCADADPSPSETAAPESVAAAGTGLLVESVQEGSATERAGVRPGDRLIGWRLEPNVGPGPQPSTGTLRSELELFELAFDVAPRGELTLVGERDGSAKSWTLPPGRLGLAAHPPLPPDLAEGYRHARELADGDRAGAAAERLAELAERASDRRQDLAAWLHFRAAGRWERGGDAAAAADAYRAAIRAAVAGGDRRAEARIRYAFSVLLWQRLGDPEAADREAEAAAAIWTDAGSELAAADARHLQGAIAFRRGDLPAAQASLGRALELKRRWAADSLTVAVTLNVTGMVTATTGDLAGAETLMEEAAEIRRSLDPDGLAHASSLSALGTLRQKRGDLAGAEADLRGALERYEAHDPRGRAVAVALNNLGVVANERGDVAAAERYFRRALELQEATAPDGLGVSYQLHNLAALARRRGDLDAAEELSLRALAIRRRIAPNSIDVAFTLDNLAGIALDRGDPETGLGHLAEALAIQTALAPDSVDVARTEGHLGRFELARGDLAAADRHLRRAEGLYRRLAPRRYQLGRMLTDRGEVAEAADDPAAAERRFRDAAEHLSRAAPDTEFETDALWGLARVLRDTGRGEEALEAYRRAEAALEAQAGRLGGSHELRSGFRARYRRLYRQHLELELELARPEAAFSVLERSRARELLAMLHQRDLVFAADLEPELDAERRRAMASVDLAQEALLEAPPAIGSEAVEERLRTLASARRRLQEVVDRVLRAAPRLAALTEPVPATVETALASLDPGTVALVYSLGEVRSEVFVLGPGGGFRVAPVAASEAELRHEVERLRHLLRLGPAASPTAAAEARAARYEAAQRLYRLLIEPAADAVAEADRLLIVPDGALHLLPFAALERGGDPPGPLGTIIPLHTTASMSIWSEIRGRRATAAGRPTSLAAFGDPTPPLAIARGAAVAGGGGDQRPVERSGSLARLPASRDEVAAVAARFARASTYFDAEATEGRARAATATESHLHFAVHGFLDQRFPLSSGLVLARDREDDGGGNGLLQAWEIFEAVRTEADLVTLSGCETALGSEVAGEGLLGLTRAFQHAGARAVLASLWQVSDRSTAALMDRFYRHLRDGAAPAEALRGARAELAAGPVSPPSAPAGWWQRLGLRLGLVEPPPPEDFSHPWHWAGFRLDGDWR